MRILVDTREQSELEFTVGGVVTEVRRETVPVGDYWCEYEDGTRPPVFFERKSIADLFSTFGKGHKRFMNEIELARMRGWKLFLVMEATMSRIREGYEYSTLSGDSVIQKAHTLYARYGLVPVYCNGREEVASYIVEQYSAIGRCWKSKGQPLETLFGGLQMPLAAASSD